MHILYICTHIKHMFTRLDQCVSSLRRGHADLLCIVPILMDYSRRESLILINIISDTTTTTNNNNNNNNNNSVCV